MKKNTFLSGLGAKLALAVVAVAAMFTSCSNEDIQFNVTSVNATFVINPVVTYDGVDVTSQATISYSNGNGTYTGNPAIEASSVEVTASYNGKSETKTVSIPALKAAQTQAVSVLITLASDLTYNFSNSGEPKVTKTSEALDDLTWDNTSDFYSIRTIEYTSQPSQDVKIVSNFDNDADLDEILAQAKAKYSVNLNDVTNELQAEVGAHSRLLVKKIVTTTVQTVNVEATNNTTRATYIVAVLEVTTNEFGLDATGDNVIPGHGHSPAGHGHGHGDDTNAGGGIVIGE